MHQSLSKMRNVTQILDRMTGDDEEMQQLITEETLNAEVARLIYEARTVAGLTHLNSTGFDLRVSVILCPAVCYSRKSLAMENH